MARRAKNKVSVSLFPFMSILACVIGTLTLMLTAMALGQMDNEVVYSAERYKKVEDQIKKEQQLLRKLEEQLKEVGAGMDEELMKANLRREELERQIAALQDAREAPAEMPDIPPVDEEKHKKRMEAIQEELAEINEEIAKLQPKVAELGDAEESKVIIQPSGSGIDLDPTFIECTASGLIFLEEEPPRRLRKADMAGDEAFLALLDGIAKQPKGIVIFLVRDDALDTYFAAHDIARAHYARAGKLPVIGQGQIDLSVFNQLKKK
ncbi:MAG: hypothetical protein GXX96_14165 [Planctomycetaceae bacterium]|jgi:hypothetical protein|nr:hypothetical protein [Planctomycetaceae bacterium]